MLLIPDAVENESPGLIYPQGCFLPTQGSATNKQTRDVHTIWGAAHTLGSLERCLI